MKLKTLYGGGHIILKEYDGKECLMIFTERNSYVLECVRSYGEDYGGCQCSENRETRYEEIIPERILVKNGHFCGALLLLEYDGTYDEAILLKDGSVNGRARDGFRFSNDDHDRRDYTDYYLVGRPDDI